MTQLLEALSRRVVRLLERRGLLLAIAEMYVQGVSTRHVKRIVEELCGLEVSSSQVSRAAAELDTMLEAWRSRDLGCSVSPSEAEHLLAKFLNRYEKTAPGLVKWAEEALPEGFTVFDLSPGHRRKLRTTNLVERLNEEIRRGTRVARLFPNEAACLRLVSAVLMERSED